MSTPSDGTPPAFFERVGGTETFRRLTEVFYAGVSDDPVLRPLYAEEDLEPARRRLQMFLEQYWGGPRAYSEQRGHPRLRMRHGGWRIGEREREAWLSHMRAGVDELHLDPADEKELWDYLVMAAYSLVNEAPEGAPLPVVPGSGS
ncbi:hemoglobin [Motilibacter peucedani]|uniref:Hemoglobin n=1 Tax=Motilibacter peucedani TaxID=598650 RepID=A0A420XNQ4_9ACTN|nr:globin [Motilibacter peucedani]RKS73802.1 hemoglobin [Motilibacter peucedani]